MKYLLCSIVCLSLILGAQNRAKADFIHSGGYLSVTRAAQAYGDSLDGFDEGAVKARLLANNVAGVEYMSCMLQNRRHYINKRYRIGNESPWAGSVLPQQNPAARPIGGNNIISSLPCNNEDFELTPVGSYTGGVNATAISGWTISSFYEYTSACPSSSWVPGSPKVWVLNTPIFNVPGMAPCLLRHWAATRLLS